jgi:hypothetical protein
MVITEAAFGADVGKAGGAVGGLDTVALPQAVTNKVIPHKSAIPEKNPVRWYNLFI